VEDYILDQFPDFDEIEVLILPMDLRAIDSPAGTGETNGASGQYLYEYMMKMLTLMVGDSYEVYVCDQLVFDRYAPQGAFADLTTFYTDLQNQLPADVLAKIKPLYRAPDNGDEEGQAAESEPVLFGLDVSELRLAQGLGFYSDTQILTLGVKASAVDEAAAFLENWIKDYQEMNTRQSEFEATLPTESK